MLLYHTWEELGRVVWGLWLDWWYCNTIKLCDTADGKSSFSSTICPISYNLNRLKLKNKHFSIALPRRSPVRGIWVLLTYTPSETTGMSEGCSVICNWFPNNLLQVYINIRIIGCKEILKSFYCRFFIKIFPKPKLTCNLKACLRILRKNRSQ